MSGAWVHEPTVWPDNRGSFHEVFKHSELSELLRKPFPVRQVNQNTSSKGVIRGIHFTDSVEGQSKYVSCPRGAIWDVVVDLRPGSETYGRWDSVVLSSENRKSVIISEGLGHAFLSLEDFSTVHYLSTAEYDSVTDRTLNPLSPSLAIPFLRVADACQLGPVILSNRDEIAPPFTF
jgi:dTDP-4-dehydrorhamnose 3,5-epimerase